NCGCVPCSGQVNDQRNMEGGVVDEKSVRLFAMLAEAFAMIAAQHNERVFVQTFLFQELQQAADLRIGKGDFTIVRTNFVLLTVRWGRPIWEMWVVEMHPKEKVFAGILSEPL